MRNNLIILPLMSWCLAAEGQSIPEPDLENGLWEYRVDLKKTRDIPGKTLHETLTEAFDDRLESEMANRGLILSPDKTQLIDRRCLTPKKQKDLLLPGFDTNKCTINSAGRSKQGVIEIRFTCRDNAKEQTLQGYILYTPNEKRAYTYEVTVSGKSGESAWTSISYSTGQWLQPDCGDVKPLP